jgi:hypothetical protein
MVLKDSAGLVKLYALVNVENYAIVATGSTQTEAKEEYLKLLKQNGLIDKIPEKEEVEDSNSADATVEIADIRVYTVGGESVFYITDADGHIYKQRLCDDESLIILKNGDIVNIKYKLDNNALVREMISFKVLPAEPSADAENKAE